MSNANGKTNKDPGPLTEIRIQRWIQTRDPMLNFYLLVENLVFKYWQELASKRLLLPSLSPAHQDTVSLLANLSDLGMGLDANGDVFLIRDINDLRFELPRIAVKYRIKLPAVVTHPVHRLI